jgi:general secretion pathway protein D
MDLARVFGPRTFRGYRMSSVLLSAASVAALLTGCADLPTTNRMHDRFAELVEPAAPVADTAPVRLTPAGAPATAAAARPAYVERGGLRIRVPAMANFPTPRGDGVELNFPETDIREFARAVLGDILGLSYSVDPRIEGTVSLDTRGAIPRADVLTVVERVLQMHGAALVPFANGYQVVPAEAALSAGAGLAGGPGSGVRILPLRHVEAAKAAELLKPLVPNGAAVTVEPQRNLLLLAGTRSQLETLEATALAIDLDRLKGMSFALMPLRYAAAGGIVDEMSTIFAGEKDLSDVRFVALDRINAVVVVSRTPENIDRMMSWIDRLDQDGGGAEPELFVYPVQNGRARDLATALGQIFGAEGGSPAPVGDVAPGLRPVRSASLGGGFGQRGNGGRGGMGMGIGAGSGMGSGGGSGGAGGLGNIALTAPGLEGTGLDAGGGNGLPGGSALNGGAGGGGGGGAGAVAAPGLRIIADDSRNALIVHATRQEYRRIENALRQLDILPMQVMIEATIAEVTLNDELQYGLQWFFNSGRFSAILSRSGGTPAPSLPGFAAIFNSADARVVLNALSSITDVRVISSPQVLALTNQTAMLQVGDSVPVPVQQAVSVLQPDAPIVNSIQFVDTGVTLSVTPRVNEGGTVMLEVEQNVSEASRTTSSGIDAPTIQQRRIASTVAVKNGETIGLGGLIRDSATKGRDGVPILSTLPVVGPLFGTDTTAVRRTELLVLLRPRIVQTPQDAREMTNELRAKMLGMQPIVVRPNTVRP